MFNCVCDNLTEKINGDFDMLDPTGGWWRGNSCFPETFLPTNLTLGLFVRMSFVHSKSVFSAIDFQKKWIVLKMVHLVGQLVSYFGSANNGTLRSQGFRLRFRALFPYTNSPILAGGFK